MLATSLNQDLNINPKSPALAGVLKPSAHAEYGIAS
tara:strand:- start:460 stop:567 length:108 start_codon:yes stop_codon:yes gene_type:complete